MSTAKSSKNCWPDSPRLAARPNATMTGDWLGRVVNPAVSPSCPCSIRVSSVAQLPFSGLRFVPSSRTTTQNSVPAGGLAFAGWDWLSTEFRGAVSASALPLLQGLSWRDRFPNLRYRGFPNPRALGQFQPPRMAEALPTGKSAIQQVRKPALHRNVFLSRNSG